MSRMDRVVVPKRQVQIVRTKKPKRARKKKLRNVNKQLGQTVLNIQPLRSFKFKGIYPYISFSGSGAVGTLNPLNGIQNFKITDIGNYSALKTLFRQYRINWVTVALEFLQQETNDMAYIPTVYCRYNYDPDLTTGTIDEAYMENLRNVVMKKLTTYGDVNKTAVVRYKLKPCTFEAKQIYGTVNYVPNPVFNEWMDFTGTTEIQYSGFAWFISNLGSGTSLTMKYYYEFECRDPIMQN